jgi:hypothetical protein
MTEEKTVKVVAEEIERELDEKANPQADAPKKNAVAPETSNIASMSKYDDLGAPVVKPTDSNPTPQKNQQKQKTKVMQKQKTETLTSHLTLRKV